VRAALVLSVWLVALGSCASGPSGAAPTGSPPIDACEVDADCAIVVAGPGGSDPCCDVTLTAAPRSVAYMTYMTDWRASHCSAPRCAPLELPGHPMECAHEARCLAGRCGNACPPAPAPR